LGTGESLKESIVKYKGEAGVIPRDTRASGVRVILGGETGPYRVGGIISGTSTKVDGSKREGGRSGRKNGSTGPGKDAGIFPRGGIFKLESYWGHLV